ncbi:hypothetical protein [Azospirillum canadense]|uniref:hypothetical protein n=1 Tax=Azospirillum canadense TaxID=403962 RepID=UPI002226A9E6|nr:hypothetical protein [Azospirillum canadense]MCW2242263.1 hypothetical protein [Azospirillum canadense]
MIYLANPRRMVPRWAWEMVRLWRLFQGGMSLGFMPEMAGAMDQSSKMLDAFSVMSAFEAEMKDEGDQTRWTKKQVRETREAIAKAKELYPDGLATGPLLEATLKSRRRA